MAGARHIEDEVTPTRANARENSSQLAAAFMARYQKKAAFVVIGVATGGSLPPPQYPIGDPLRSIQIRGDFEVGKNGGRSSAPRQIFELKI